MVTCAAMACSSSDGLLQTKAGVQLRQSGSTSWRRGLALSLSICCRMNWCLRTTTNLKEMCTKQRTLKNAIQNKHNILNNAEQLHVQTCISVFTAHSLKWKYWDKERVLCKKRKENYTIVLSLLAARKGRMTSVMRFICNLYVFCVLKTHYNTS